MYPKLLKIKKISNVIILLCEWFFNGLFINCHQKETIHYYIILITSRPKAGKPAEATQQAATSKRKTRAKAELQIKIFTATQQYRLYRYFCIDTRQTCRTAQSLKQANQ